MEYKYSNACSPLGDTRKIKLPKTYTIPPKNNSTPSNLGRMLLLKTKYPKGSNHKPQKI